MHEDGLGISVELEAVGQHLLLVDEGLHHQLRAVLLCELDGLLNGALETR